MAMVSIVSRVQILNDQDFPLLLFTWFFCRGCPHITLNLVNVAVSAGAAERVGSINAYFHWWLFSRCVFKEAVSEWRLVLYFRRLNGRVYRGGWPIKEWGIFSLNGLLILLFSVFFGCVFQFEKRFRRVQYLNHGVLLRCGQGALILIDCFLRACWALWRHQTISK